MYEYHINYLENRGKPLEKPGLLLILFALKLPDNLILQISSAFVSVKNKMPR
jgi:hypothetical protein